MHRAAIDQQNLPERGVRVFKLQRAASCFICSKHPPPFCASHKPRGRSTRYTPCSSPPLPPNSSHDPPGSPALLQLARPLAAVNYFFPISPRGFSLSSLAGRAAVCQAMVCRTSPKIGVLWWSACFFFMTINLKRSIIHCGVAAAAVSWLSDVRWLCMIPTDREGDIDR